MTHLSGESARPMWTVLSSREEFGRPELPLLSMSAALGIRTREVGEGRAASEDLNGYRVVRPGDLVVNRLSARDGAFGRSPSDGIISPAYWVLVGSPEIDSRFADYLLHSSPYMAEIRRISRSMPPAQFDLQWEQFKWMSFPTLSLERQRWIADFLDDQVARIDGAVQLRGEQLGLMRRRQLAGIDTALCDATSPAVPLGLVAHLQTGMALNGNSVKTSGMTRPYLRVANVKEDYLDLAEVREVIVDRADVMAHSLQVGDVLMTEGGDIDKLGRGTLWGGEILGAVHQNHVFALRPSPNVMDATYLALMTQTSYARHYFETTASRSTNLASTNAGTVRSFRVPLPSLADQRARAARARRVVAEVKSANAEIRT